MEIGIYIAINAILGITYAELSGYTLHRLFHTDKIPFLSRSHMRHHLTVFPPTVSQQKDDPGTPLIRRILRSGVGVEWIPPIIVVFGLAFGAFALLEVQILYQITFFTALILWTAFLFLYMHDAMHVRGHWLAQNKVLGTWFRSARSKHDAHHITVNSEGRLKTNYGICFFFFDRLFGTYCSKCTHPDEAKLNRLYDRFPHLRT